MYPSDDDPHNGTFVYDEVAALKEFVPDIEVLHFDTRISKLNYFKAFYLLKKAIRKFKPDVIHCHHTFCVFIAWLAGFKKIVLTFHEGEYLSTESYWTLLKREGFGKCLVLSRRFKQFSLKRTEYIFDVTGALKTWENAISPYAPGVNPDVFHPVDTQAARNQLKWDVDKNYILFPGHPNDTCKRFDISEEIVSIVKSKMTEPVKLVPLTGIPHDKVPIYMNAADVMLLVSDYEASPMVVKEAVACGLPCVCYNVGDVAKVLDGNPQSFVVPKDKREAADKVLQIFNEPVVERKKRLNEEFTSRYAAKRIYSVYQNLDTMTER